MQLGIAMNGLEKRVLDIAKGVANHFDEITYVEIGVGEGVTLTAIARTLKDSGKAWRAIGIELVNGYSFNLEHTRKSAAEREVNLNFVTPNGAIVHPLWETVTIYFKDSQSFLTEIWQEPIHFALIDGCHGKPCVTLDFLALEAFMVPNGVLMFHDFSQEQVGQAQPHCVGGIDVRGACQDLGLTNGKRANWKFDETITADRTKGGWDMAIFKKV
jgi:Methyltransferase domain